MTMAVLFLEGSRRRWRTRSGIEVRAVAWWTGWGVLVASLYSPLDRWGTELFSMHMVQHELLMLVAAPLLVLARPAGILAAPLPKRWTRRMALAIRRGPTRMVWVWLTLPACAWTLHAFAIWAWHAPALFEASLRNDYVHDLQHVSFFASALLFWWSVLDRGRTRAGSSVYVFATMLHTSVLGMLLTFAATPLYPFYTDTAPAWGMSPLEDQQIGGLVMWIPSGALLLVVILILASQVLSGRGRAPPTHSRVAPQR